MVKARRGRRGGRAVVAMVTFHLEVASWEYDGAPHEAVCACPTGQPLAFLDRAAAEGWFADRLRQPAPEPMPGCTDALCSLYAPLPYPIGEQFTEISVSRRSGAQLLAWLELSQLGERGRLSADDFVDRALAALARVPDGTSLAEGRATFLLGHLYDLGVTARANKRAVRWKPALLDMLPGLEAREARDADTAKLLSGHQSGLRRRANP